MGQGCAAVPDSGRRPNECGSLLARAEQLLHRRQYWAAAEACEQALVGASEGLGGAGDEAGGTGDEALTLEMQVRLCCVGAEAQLKGAEREGPASRAAAAHSAYELASAALELDPSSRRALLFRGSASAAVGQLAAARMDLERVVRMDPSCDIAARELLAVRERQRKEQDMETPGFSGGLDATTEGEAWRRSAFSLKEGRRIPR